MTARDAIHHRIADRDDDVDDDRPEQQRKRGWALSTRGRGITNACP